MEDDLKRGKFLLELRVKKNLTQIELGKMINYSDKAISKWERGICFPKSPIVLLKLAKIFNVSVKEIIKGEYINHKNNCFFFTYYLIIILFVLISFSLNFLDNYNGVVKKDVDKNRNINFKYSDVLIQNGFIDTDDYFYKDMDDVNIYYYYNIKAFKVISDDNYFQITTFVDYNNIVIEIYDKEFKIISFGSLKIKNCDKNNCSTYEDYAMYLNYLKKLIK